MALLRIRRGRRPIHPGQFLDTRYLRPLHITQQRLARELGISRRRINELIKCHRGITPDTAIRLAIHFRTSPEFWLSMQSAWDTYAAWQRWRDTIRARPR